MKSIFKALFLAGLSLAILAGPAVIASGVDTAAAQQTKQPPKKKQCSCPNCTGVTTPKCISCRARCGG